MAEVISRAPTSERIEHALAYSEQEWAAVGDLPMEWAEMDSLERNVFELEWVVKEDFLHDLARWQAQGCLRASQVRRYTELLALVAKHRPIVERLFAEA